MNSGLGLTGSNPDLIAIALIGLVDENKSAEALYHLFMLHKRDLQLWVRVKNIAIRRASTHRRLSMTNSIVNASACGSLPESCVIIPGLSSYLATQMETTKFSDTASQDTKNETINSQDNRSSAENNWTKFCQSNPSYPGCRFYEI